MAVQILLARREDTAAVASDVSSISLLSNTDGFDLEYYDGWTQAVPQGLTPGNLAETLNLIVTGSDKDDLAANLQGLDDKLKETEWYWDEPTERYGVWLRAQLTDEKYARQALIRRGEGQPGESLYGPYTDRGNVMRRYALGLERLPWWEDTTGESYSPGAMDYGGETKEVGNTVGDVPSRIAWMSLASASGDLDEFWLGFRTNRLVSDRTNFKQKWECEAGTMLIADTTAGGTYTTTTFATDATMASRFYVKTSDITVNYSDQRGQFIVLMRAQLSAGSTTTRVRLLDGYSTTVSNLRRQNRVVIDSTEWKLYSLGTIQIPPLAGLTTSDMFKSYGLLLQAERTAGAGSLRCDKFILIPISEGALYASNVAMTTSNHVGRIRITPDGTVNGRTYSDAACTDIIMSMAPRPQGPYSFTLPVNNGLAVFAGQGATSHVEADHVELTFYWLHRWRTLRGEDSYT